ncbi:putative GST-like protein YibF [Pseudoalteromonas sp. P1-9]|uniref:glutathione S-transferase family protein n=1 Tax=Pseudoalteromonas sp. P1-9 TaxID=1710354 RepID=UPI0006D60257|nr:glutathione S-transferase family protein [Pseudoalteromonas sp. P1-9]KPV96597.1 putative GST-like protein YibF [Pseudoalteromonas sp. P1-9]
MQLYGSLTSPYVRRLRALAIEKDIEFDFLNLNIFAEKDRETLVKLNPTRKIPMLVDGEQVIFDSNVIYRYLAQKLDFTPLSWNQENTLTLINSANDSLVELLICQRSEFDTNDDKLFFNLQRERINGVLSVLNDAAEQGAFSDYNYVALSLFCLLDWIIFRNLTDLTRFSALQVFHSEHKNRASSIETAPRD